MKMPLKKILYPSLTSLRLVATDLDQTLLRADKTISTHTATLLQRLQVSGIVIVLASARPPRGLRQLVQDFHIGKLAICCNGAIIYDLEQDCTLYTRSILPQQISDLISLLRASIPDLSFAAESGQAVTCEAEFLPFCTKDDFPLPQIMNSAEICQEPQIKILVHHATLASDELYACVAPLLNSNIYSVTYSGQAFLEISHGKVQKGEALAELCTQLDIAAQNVVAFGDMPNDLSMLQWAGLGVAVANAHPLVLQAADAVTLSNEEDGVAQMLAELIEYNVAQ